MLMNIKKHIQLKTKIYSSEYGVGVITGLYRLYDGIEDYIEISFFKGDFVKNFPLHRKLEFELLKKA